MTTNGYDTHDTAGNKYGELKPKAASDDKQQRIIAEQVKANNVMQRHAMSKKKMPKINERYSSMTTNDEQRDKDLFMLWQNLGSPGTFLIFKEKLEPFIKADREQAVLAARQDELDKFMSQTAPTSKQDEYYDNRTLSLQQASQKGTQE